MTGRALSLVATASLVEEATDEVWLVLMEITHADMADTIRVVNNTEAIVSDGETYVGLPFAIEFPDEGDRPGEARISIDNVDRRIVEAVRSITTPPTVKLQVILASQPDTIEFELDGLKLRDVTYDAAQVQGYLRFEDLSVEPVAALITPERFPGLFAAIFALLISAQAFVHAVG